MLDWILKTLLISHWLNIINNFLPLPPCISILLHFLCKGILKGALMQTSKCPYMFVFIEKKYLENFDFLTLRILELYAREVCKFLKK